MMRVYLLAVFFVFSSSASAGIRCGGTSIALGDVTVDDDVNEVIYNAVLEFSCQPMKHTERVELRRVGEIGGSVPGLKYEVTGLPESFEYEANLGSGGAHSIFFDVTVRAVGVPRLESGTYGLRNAVTYQGVSSGDRQVTWERNINSHEITVVKPSCLVIGSERQVALPSVYGWEFDTVGERAGITRFDLDLKCNKAMSYNIQFSDSNDAANNSTLLSLSSDSTAKGVGVEMLDGEGEPIHLGKKQKNYGPSGTSKIEMSARYVRVGELKAGLVKARASFLITYD